MQIYFTAREAQANIELLDLAVKHAGLAVAQAALNLAAKMQAAMLGAESADDVGGLPTKAQREAIADAAAAAQQQG